MKTSKALLLSLSLTAASAVDAQDAHKFFPDKDLMTVGIYYYPEHWSPLQWERDIKQIATIGFEFIHLAEFAWAQMEPEEGKYDFAWLDRVLELAEKYNLKVVLCTPSATPPVWLGIKHPETYIMNSNHLRSEHGTRANGSLSNGIFRQYVERINTEMARRYGHNKTVAGSSLACSYRFRQILYGAEQYHSGIVKTDGVTLSPGGEEYMQFIRELKELRKLRQPGRRYN
jgi:beta-galactosidase